MTSTPPELPPAAGPPAGRPPAPAAAGPAALLQNQINAECELAEALARFQAEVRPAAGMSLPAVVEAARGAFRLGFAYSACRGLDEDGQPLLEVTLMHRGGEQLSSQLRLPSGEPEQEFNAAGRLLAQLLGIPVLSAAQQAQPRKAEPGEADNLAPSVVGVEPAVSVAAPTPAARAASGPAAAPPAAACSAVVPAPPATEGAAAISPSPAAAAAPAGSAPAAAAAASAPPADPVGPGSPGTAATEESLRPLLEEEREVLLEMVRSLRPVEARRQFQIAFRHHFKVPKQARSIAGFITQQRHKDFIDRFERELADLPPAGADKSPAQVEASA
jgi:hypothetical protein